jgi:predicted cupin superfamily sugar epimerase
MLARDLIHTLGLTRHPEGGWYRELYRSPARVTASQGERSAVTTIYYLLEQAEHSRWHVVASDEIWHFLGGAALELLSYDPAARALRRQVLDRAEGGCEPVAVVPAGLWQAARSLGDYSLIGCCVGPGFEFADFRFVASLAEHKAHLERLGAFRELL